MNSVDAALVPIDVRNTTVVGGAMGHVTAEVLVSYLARRVFGIERRTILELIAIHSLSVPLQGGLSAFAEGADKMGFEAPMASQFMDGAKGIPGVFAATYIANTFMDGMHFPRLNVKDILITAASKIITRPIVSVLYQPLGPTFRNGQDALEKTFQLQREESALKMS